MHIYVTYPTGNARCLSGVVALCQSKATDQSEDGEGTQSLLQPGVFHKVAVTVLRSLRIQVPHRLKPALPTTRGLSVGRPGLACGALRCELWGGV